MRRLLMVTVLILTACGGRPATGPRVALQMCGGDACGSGDGGGGGKQPSDTLRLSTVCPFWTVWSFQLDGAAYGGNWGFQDTSLMKIVLPQGNHSLDATRWSPSITEFPATVATGQTYPLPCS